MNIDLNVDTGAHLSVNISLGVVAGAHSGVIVSTGVVAGAHLHEGVVAIPLACGQ